MWCKNCHAGNPTFNFPRCGQCGGTDFISKDPRPGKAVRSIRAMDKRVVKTETKNNAKVQNEDITKITGGDLKSINYEDVLNR